MSDYIARTDDYMPTDNTLSNYRAIIGAAIDEHTYGFIYLITCNGKYYVGLTAQEDKYKRIGNHVQCVNNGENTHLYNAIRKYGIINTRFEVLDTTAITPDGLETLEKEYIINYDSFTNGYNKTLGGEGILGFKYTEEQKKEHGVKLRQFHKDNPEVGASMSVKKKAFHVANPDAAKQHGDRMIQIHKNNPDLAVSMSAKKKAFHVANPDAAKQHSITMTQLYGNEPERRDAMSVIKKAFYAKNPNAGTEHGAKLRQIHKDNPELGASMSTKKKAFYKDNPEVKASMSVKKKAFHLANPDAAKQHSVTMSQLYINEPERRDAMSVIKKALHVKNPIAIYNKYPKKPFEVRKRDGTYFGTFDYQGFAKKALLAKEGIMSIDISAVLRGKRSHSLGYTFKYVETDTTNGEPSPI